MRADCKRIQATWQSLAVLADPGLRIKHRRRALALAVAWALGGALTVALNPAAVAQPFPATLPLSSLDGSNGFKLDGEAVGDKSGCSVGAAGDINGDGIADLLIGAPGADPNGQLSGRTYVVFGSSSGFAAIFPLSSLNGTHGFRIDGEAMFDESGSSVSAAGDVNGDGIDDLIIGADGADPNGSYSGRSYVVFGARGRRAASIPLSSLDGTNGFALDGEAARDFSGGAVSAAGDVNGDGIDDLIIGAFSADFNGPNSGRSYVVFGSASGFSSSVPLSSLSGGNGFKLDGESALHYSGGSVSAAGDVNGDGIGDVIIGATAAAPNGGYSGRSYVVFGSNSGFAAAASLFNLNGSNGFKIDGEAQADQSGISVSSAGDFNGDGFDDLIIGAPFADHIQYNSGRSYVVFGSSDGFPAALSLANLDGSNGFELGGEEIFDRSGTSVGSAGDVNADGFADLIIGAFAADPNGSYSGRSYVVFGSGEPFAAVVPLSSLDGTSGFKLDGEAGHDESGISVSGVGDVNGDGIDDLLIGASTADPAGNESGRSYVVFGRDAAFVFANGFE